MQTKTAPDGQVIEIEGQPYRIPHNGTTARIVPHADGLHLILHDRYGVQINNSLARVLDEAFRRGLYGKVGD